MPILTIAAGIVIVAFIGLLGAVLIWKIADRTIDLSHLLAEKNGQASFSRFQFLVFTFVIAMAILVLSLESGEIPALGADVLGLLGISGGSYVVSKGIQKSAERDSAARTGATPPVGGDGGTVPPGHAGSGGGRES